MHRPAGHVTRWLRPEFCLSAPEQVHLMLIPHLHLDRLLAGERDAGHVASVAGVFNVALAMAYLKKDRRAIQFYSGIQVLMLALASSSALSARDNTRLRKALAAADEFICQQHKADVLAAIRLVEHQIKVSPPDSFVDVTAGRTAIPA